MTIHIRDYIIGDKEKCIEVFQSNCPKYFDKDELNLFIHWLDHQGDSEHEYQSPTYRDAEKDAYYVLDHQTYGVVGCGGFYIVKDLREARLAWGMIHSQFHRQGFGKALYQYRKEKILEGWPQHSITMGTSQHTFPFYEKMGMQVTAIIKAGYGPDLDRYDMTQS